MRWMIVAPTWDLMSSPMIGSPRFSKRFAPVRLRSDEDRDAIDEGAAGLQHLLHVPLRRHLGADRQIGDDYVGFASSSGSRRCRPSLHGPFGTTCLRYLPRPSWVMPAVDFDVRDLGTSAKRMVLFGSAKIASPRSLPTFVRVDVESRGELDVAGMISAEIHVHQSGNEIVLLGVLGRSARPGRGRRRSCRRR